MKRLSTTSASLLLGLYMGVAQPALSSTVDDLQATYRALGATTFDATRGELHWFKTWGDRQCTQCHGQQVDQPGKHIKTGKLIKAMAPSVNSQRLSDPDKVEKWFLRNCRWTMGRVCTPQEKGDLLEWLKEQ